MSSLPPDERPKRRKRYSGKNPRRFEDKYKELSPEEYAKDVAKVIASGKTPAGTHRPIMVQEILEALAPKPGETAADCTLGFGGHAMEILAKISPGGILYGLDVDPIEQPKTEQRIRNAGYGPDTFQARATNFAGLQKLVVAESLAGLDVVLADLGVSSMQIDNPSRGFTFKADGPLDLRLNPNRGQSAADLLAKTNVDTLATLLVENSDEPKAHVIATAIMESQANTPITRTKQLATIIQSALAGPNQTLKLIDASDTLGRVFQALRIAVNNEFSALDSLLRVLPDCLKPKGRVALLTFHSGEDRRVKKAFQAGLRDGTYSSISTEITRASFEERHSNSRSTCAKLRWAIRAE